MTTLPAHPAAKAVHTWSLFRTLGSYIAPGSMPSGDMPESNSQGMDLLELPAELARRGFGSVQLCHFYLPSRTPAYLTELKDAFAQADVEIECLLIDDGDITDPVDVEGQQRWIADWVTTAHALGARRTRVIAGKQAPTPATLALSARRLSELAADHPDVRVVTENWHALLPDAGSVNQLLDATDGQVGFLIDLGNWTGPGKYAELAAVAARAETCQAKVATDDGLIDEGDFLHCLTVLRDANYAGPLALVYEGPDPDEWAHLDQAHRIVDSVFGPHLQDAPAAHEPTVER